MVSVAWLFGRSGWCTKIAEPTLLCKMKLLELLFWIEQTITEGIFEVVATATTISASAATVSPFATSLRRSYRLKLSLFSGKAFNESLPRLSPIQVTNESSRTQVSISPGTDKSDADKIVDGLDFGELCNEFECISSPLVESTARQLVRDILELREGNRAIGTYAVSVKYKDPVRSFTGRDKYKRPLWATDALQKPSVAVQGMTMLSTSVLKINWTIKGRPKSLLAVLSGDLIVKVESKFTLNQISGQVIEHEESWDLSSSSPIAKAYFWASRGLFSTFEAGKDVAESAKSLSSRLSTPKENVDIYPDPTGDPTKFFPEG